jgi:hypothetical protein
VDRIDELNEQIRGVVVERQALRAVGADEERLESNRRKLIALHRLLAQALVVRYACAA